MGGECVPGINCTFEELSNGAKRGFAPCVGPFLPRRRPGRRRPRRSLWARVLWWISRWNIFTWASTASVASGQIGARQTASFPWILGNPFENPEKAHASESKTPDPKEPKGGGGSVWDLFDLEAWEKYGFFGMLGYAVGLLALGQRGLLVLNLVAWLVIGTVNVTILCLLIYIFYPCIRRVLECCGLLVPPCERCCGYVAMDPVRDTDIEASLEWHGHATVRDHSKEFLHDDVRGFGGSTTLRQKRRP